MVELTAVNASSYAYSGSRTPLLNWRTALAKAQAGIAKTNVLVLGDSTNVGYGSVGGSGATGAGMKTLNVSTRLAAQLTARGINSSAENCFGDFGYGASATTYDARLALGSWTFSAVVSALGGNLIFASATTATPASFTPSTQTDTCEIYYLTNTSLGSFNANVNGGLNTLQSTITGSPGVGKLTISGTLGANVYNVTWASGGNVFIIGFSAYNSAKKEVSIVNVSRGNRRAGELQLIFAGLAAQLAAFSPSLTVVQLGINDWINNTIATFAGDIAAIIAAKPATSDMVFLAPINSGTGVMAQATQDQYTTIIRSAALAAGMPYIDVNARNGGYAGANAAGMMFSDNIHGNAYMYGDEANLLTNLLLNT